MCPKINNAEQVVSNYLEGGHDLELDLHVPGCLDCKAKIRKALETKGAQSITIGGHPVTVDKRKPVAPGR